MDADKQHALAATTIDMVGRRGFDAADGAERLLYAISGKTFDDLERKDAKRLVNKLRHAAGQYGNAVRDLAGHVASLGDDHKPVTAQADDDAAVTAVDRHLASALSGGFLEKLDAYMHPAGIGDPSQEADGIDDTARSATPMS